MSLQNNKCIPCTIGTPVLSKKEAETLLKQLANGWCLNDKMHIEKNFLFKDFRGAMNFAKQVAIIAENEGHHPKLYVQWGECIVEIWTHKINGLSKSDFYLAAKIDTLCGNEK